METEAEKFAIEDRATQIQTGAVPIASENAQLSIPKADFMLTQTDHSFPSNWSFSELLSQRKKVGTFDITSSTSSGTKIWEFRHTFGNVVDLHFRNMKTLFRIWKWNLHFLFEFRSFYQQLGQALIVNHCIPQAVLHSLFPRNEKLESSYSSMVQLPHRKIMLGEDVDVEATLVWNAPVEGTMFYDGVFAYPKTIIPAQQLTQYDMGSIFLTLPWPMEVAKGVQATMTVTIWSWLTDVRMSAYEPQDSIL